MRETGEGIRYCIFDPTGNITALVESEVDAEDQPAVAARIMELEPAVEQVGFVAYAADAEQADHDSGMDNTEAGVPVSLRMAGGEFCGNATMCAAALFAIRSGLQGGEVPVKVAGVSEPFTVSLELQAGQAFSAAVSMPPALSIGALTVTEDTAAGGAAAGLPLVKMEGISHIIVEPDSGFFGLKKDSELAESLLRQWCSETGADCLGMMFLGEAYDGDDEDSPRKRSIAGTVPAGTSGTFRTLTPLVFVPGADTMFWENSCASGSAAAGMYLAAKDGAPVDVTFDEPAGRLRVESDPFTGTTVLHGSAILREG